MRLRQSCYRAHDPQWAFKPLSGDGAAIYGARFNPKGMPALYLGIDLNTAILEANQGFANKINPCLLCRYEVDCDDIIDLRSNADQVAQGIDGADLACAWKSFLLNGKEPPSWVIARRFIAVGASGIVVPSFAVGATAAHCNLVLWDWTTARHSVAVHDPSGRLPKNQLSWP